MPLQGIASAVKVPTTPKVTTSVDPLYQQAVAQAKAALGAQTQPIADEQVASDSQFAQRQTDAQGVATALSNLLKGIGPAVNGEYQSAAQNQELAANGFSQGMQDALKGNTDNLNAMLAKLNAPAQLDSHAGQAGDVLYALGGFNPGTTFSKQGAAFGAAADLQAGDALLKGQENVKDLQNQAIQADQGFQQKIAELAGKLPGDIQTNYNNLQKLSLDNQKFTEQVKNDNIDAAYKTAEEHLAQAKYQTGIDEFNAKQKLAQDKLSLSQSTQHLQSKNINGHILTFDPTTGTYYVPGTSEVANPNDYKKAVKVSSSTLTKARGYLTSSKKGYYASLNDSSTPLSTSQLRSIAKDSKLTLGGLLAITDPNQLAKMGLGYVNVGQHDDPKIQQLYVTLVKKYGIPAQRAFQMVSSQYKQWGQAHQSTYFPKAGAAQGAAASPTSYTSGRLSGPSLNQLALQALQTAAPQFATPRNVQALVGRIMQESGGNPLAINNWDSNAKAGHPSKGILQTIDSTFNTYKMPGHDDIYNPLDNALAAVRYMIARYGHIVGPSNSGY